MKRVSIFLAAALMLLSVEPASAQLNSVLRSIGNKASGALRNEVNKGIQKGAEEAKQAKEQYENLENECKNRIKSLVGDNEYCKIGDTHKATWSNIAGRVTLDTKQLQKDMPEVYEKYKKVGKASRRFSMK